MTSRLDHPGICAVYDAGFDDGVSWIAMRFVEGQTLSERIASTRSGGSMAFESYYLSLGDASQNGVPEATPSAAEAERGLSVDEIDEMLRIFERAALALHAAHEAGVVHRDIKPGNIMITKSGDPVILDFGLATDRDDDQPSLTRTGDVFGTPAYMSPEQIGGGRAVIDRRTDAYSLGVSLYECLTLRPAFSAPTREALYRSILTEEPEDPRRRNRSISPELRVVLETAMAKEPDRRYATAEAFAVDLLALQKRLAIAARPVGTLGSFLRWTRRQPARAALVIALGTGVPLVTALGGFIMANLPELEAQRRVARAGKVELLLESGFYELHEGEIGVAQEHFERALALDPGGEDALAGRVLVAAKTGDAALAESLLEAVGDTFDPAAAAGLRAVVLVKGNQPAEVEQTMAAAPPPASALGHFVLGEAETLRAHRTRNHLESSRSFRRAVVHFRHAVLATPRSRRVLHLELAHAAGHVGAEARPEETVDAIETLWRANPISDLVCGRALMSVAPARAIPLLERAIAARPGTDLAERALGIALAAAGRHGDAVRRMERVLARDPTDADALNNLALCLRDAGNLEAASGVYRKLHAAHPDNRAGLLGVGNFLLAEGRAEEAAAKFRRALEFEPGDVMARINLGMALAAAGRPDEELAVLEAASGAARDEPEFRSTLATAYGRRGRFDEALEIAEGGLAADSGNVSLQRIYGFLQVAKGDLDAAMSRFMRLVDEHRQVSDGFHGLGEVFWLRGEPRTAIKWFLEGLRRQGDRRDEATKAMTDSVRGVVVAEVERLVQEDEIDLARQLLEEVLKVLPSDLSMRRLLDKL